MDKFEELAVGQYLSDWPEDASFTDIMTILHSDNEDLQDKITPWDGIKTSCYTQIAHYIQVAVRSFREAVQ